MDFQFYQKLSDECHALAVEKGWYDGEGRGKSEAIALIHSEIAEATEAVREGHPDIYQINDKKIVEPTDPKWDAKLKPEGEAVELVDAVFRICDYIGWNKWVLNEIPFKETIEGADLFVSFLHAHAQMHAALGKVFDWIDYEKEPRLLLRVVKIIESYFEHRAWDLEKTMEMKLVFNRERPYRHGGKLY